MTAFLREGEIVNDETVDQLVRAAVAQADAGADIIAPSDMMDGRIGAIRRGLDAAGHQSVASCPTPPSSPPATTAPIARRFPPVASEGRQKTYYIDPANGTEAIRDAALDVEEGADMLMVKPGLPYLDICWRMKKLRPYGLRLSGLGRIQPDQGGRRQWLDRRRTGHARNTAVVQARGCDGILTISPSTWPVTSPAKADHHGLLYSGRAFHI